MTKIKWLDDFHKANRDLEEIAQVLNDKSRAFYAVGMDTTGELLSGLAYDIDTNVQASRDAISSHILGDVKEGQAEIGRTLTALLGSATQKK